MDLFTIRRIRGPVYILTVGVLGLLAEYTRFGWSRTWPVWLILAGVFIFFERNAAAAEPLDYPPPPPGAGFYAQPPGSELSTQVRTAPPASPEPIEPR